MQLAPHELTCGAKRKVDVNKEDKCRYMVSPWLFGRGTTFKNVYTCNQLEPTPHVQQLPAEEHYSLLTA